LAGFDRQETLHELVNVLHDHFAGRWAAVWLLPEEHSAYLHVAVVDPTPEDVRFAADRAREAGWMVTVVGVRYSKDELERLKERVVHELMIPGTDGAIIGCGFSPSVNAVRIELTRLDDAVLTKVLELGPPDAFSFDVRPGARYTTL
jgi:hypothetical protein